MSQTADELPFNPDDTSGPEGCAARPVETVVAPENTVEPAGETLIDIAEELAGGFQPEPEVMVEDPVDGMPRPVDTHTHAYAPPFTHDHVVCVEDAREYVSLFNEELPEITRGMFLAERMRYGADGKEKERRRFPPDVVEPWKGFLTVATPDGRVPVRPVRPRCAHYARQLFVNHDQPDPKEFGHRLRYSFCMHPARRSIGGAAMSLQNEAVFACDLRDPPDPASVAKHLDEPDRKRLVDGSHRELLPLFNLKH